VFSNELCSKVEVRYSSQKCPCSFFLTDSLLKDAILLREFPWRKITIGDSQFGRKIRPQRFMQVPHQKILEFAAGYIFNTFHEDCFESPQDPFVEESRRFGLETYQLNTLKNLRLLSRASSLLRGVDHVCLLWSQLEGLRNSSELSTGLIEPNQEVVLVLNDFVLPSRGSTSFDLVAFELLLREVYNQSARLSVISHYPLFKVSPAQHAKTANTRDHKIDLRPELSTDTKGRKRVVWERPTFGKKEWADSFETALDASVFRMMCESLVEIETRSEKKDLVVDFASWERRTEL
jgi:hypothetical protein